ncbi:dihydrofolate reductase [Sphingomicrobium sp. XHP0239]|uniref:dihydrofolate reductase n=1 Tax=Sphingomicrobium maritimum TaxID=3133972 RepID=UPI0031CC4C04
MTDRPLAMIIARAANGAIGKDGDLPWHLPADLKRFKRLTMGGAMIMGRKTFDSLPGLLPGRRHIVLTRDADWEADGAEVAHDPDAALALAGQDPAWVIGGAEVFRVFLPRATRIELTHVAATPDADTFLDDPRDLDGWEETAREDHPATETRPAFAFVTLERAR